VHKRPLCIKDPYHLGKIQQYSIHWW